MSWKSPLGGHSEVRIFLPLLVQLEVPLVVKTGAPAPKGRETWAHPLAATSPPLGGERQVPVLGHLGLKGLRPFCVTTYLLTWWRLSFDFPAQALTDLRGWGTHQAETSTRSQETFVNPARRCLHGKRENAPSPSSTLYQQEVHSKFAWS